MIPRSFAVEVREEGVWTRGEDVVSTGRALAAVTGFTGKYGRIWWMTAITDREKLVTSREWGQ